MTEGVEQFEKIIKAFSNIPHNSSEPTWLEICRYPYNRFEEVCSKILAFYFNPKAEHQMKGLWLKSLLSAIKKPEWYEPRHDIKVNTEEYAEGKRIDITIVSDDYVIAIENKINAALYNPLETYRDYIKKKYHNKKKQALVVLSLNRIDVKHGFHWCNYKMLFNEVNSILGHYMTDMNNKYFIFMLDFMKTINNMNNTISPIEREFFAKNRKSIIKLIERYKEYNECIKIAQEESLYELKRRMNQGQEGPWTVWGKCILTVSFNSEWHRIGIDAYFEEKGGNPTAIFHTKITTWKKEDWYPYREIVLNKLQELKQELKIGYTVLEDNDGDISNRVFVELNDNCDTVENIVKHLEMVYNMLKTIAEQTKQKSKNIIEKSNSKTC